MRSKNQNLPAPTVQNSQNIELKEISIKDNGSHVNVVVSGLPASTKVTANFKVDTPNHEYDRQVSGTTSGTTPLRLRLESGWYSQFSGQTATVTYTTDQGTSDALSIKIVD